MRDDERNRDRSNRKGSEMIRLPLLLLTPFLAGCDLDVFGKNTASREAFEYRQAGLIQTPTAAEATNQQLVSEVVTTPVLDLPSPLPTEHEVVVETPYIPPEPVKPVCQAVHAIFNCGPAGEILWL